MIKNIIIIILMNEAIFLYIYYMLELISSISIFTYVVNVINILLTVIIFSENSNDFFKIMFEIL